MSTTVKDGALITIDPSDATVLDWDWGTKHLAVGVTISSSSFRLVAIRQAASPSPVTLDSDSILSGDRTTQVRIVGAGDAALGDLFQLTNSITTSESPPQIKERSIRLLVEQR
jgi:hypothetical protein